MTVTLLTRLSKMFPDEMAIIGRLVLTYGELEYLLSHAIGVAIGDQEQAVRVIYRTHGEERRIAVAEALALPKMTALGLEHRFLAATSDMQCCRKIRNQYAHGHFNPSIGGDGRPLRFIAFHDTAESNTTLSVTMKPLTIETLTAQDIFFSYVGDCLDLLANGAAEPATIPKLRWPKQMLKPPLHTLPPAQASPPLPQPPETSPQGK